MLLASPINCPFPVNCYIIWVTLDEAMHMASLQADFSW